MRHLYICSILLLFSCGSPKKSNQIQDRSNQSQTNNQSTKDSATVRIQPLYHRSRSKEFELIHTRLDIKFDWDNSLMFGTATLTLSPKFYPQNTLVLDAKGMLIHHIKYNNQLLNYEYNGEKLNIKLDKNYLKSDTITLSVQYTAQPDLRPHGGSQAIAGDKGLYFINPKGENNSKMPQIWTQGETESNSVWFPTIDAPNQKMTQDLFITVDKKLTTLSNGILVNSMEIANNQRIDHWQQKLPHAPYLTMMGIGEFAVVKDQWRRQNGTTIPVHYYVEQEWKNEASKIFGNTPEMLSYFSKLTGFEYPWDKYHQIIVREYVSGAMENTGAVIFGDMLYSTTGDLVDQNWDDIIAHELSHHWFGDLVTCESWSNLPMNESFATYFEVLWDEYKNGKDYADFHLQSDKQGYFRTIENNAPHHNLIWFDYHDKEDMFDGHSYSKGACILNMLRKTIGDEAFFESIKFYLHKHQYSTVEAHDLRLAFEAVTGLDLNWFFNQWFFAKGHPILEIQHQITSDSLEIYISQKQDFKQFPLYRLPTSVRIWDAFGVRDFPIEIQHEKETFKFSLRGELQNYIVDPNQHLLADWKQERPDSLWVHQYNNAEHYFLVKSALIALSKKDAEKYADLILSGLEDAFFDVQLEAIDQCNRIKKSHESEVKKTMLNLVKNDENSKVRASALIFLFENYPKFESLKSIALNVLSKDVSNLCKSKALYILGELDQTLAFDSAEKFELDKSSVLLGAVSELYAAHGVKEHFQFYIATMQGPYLKGQERMMIMVHLGQFLVRNKNIELRLSGYKALKEFHQKSGFEEMVYKYVIDQLVLQMNLELKSMNEEIAAYEIAKDFVWVQRLQKEKAALQELLSVYLGK